MKHIELFAGCGGMSLGLKSAGFDLFFSNEISPMAGQTFAFNFLNEDIFELSKNNKKTEKTLWIKSKFANDKLKDRLNENPFDFGKEFTDLDDKTDLEGKLLIGDVNNLLSYIIKSKKYKVLKDLDIDLVSGGPPCQSFSLAGRREKNNEKNLLPLSFAKFVGLVEPKVILLENVKGITVPFLEDDEKYYAWLEVSKAFALEGYFPVCMMINSKYFGVPQNRPRFILFAYRKDIFEKLKYVYSDIISKRIFENTEGFFDKVKKNHKDLSKIKVEDFKYYDIETDAEFFNGEILPKIINTKDNFISVNDAINDLSKNKTIASEYVRNLNLQFNTNMIINDRLNFEERNHNLVTQARFHFYQIAEHLEDIRLKKKFYKLLSQENYILDDLLFFYEKIEKHQFLIPDAVNLNNELRYIHDIEDFVFLLEKLKTKKRSQKALARNFPAPAQLTIPDDVCHYEETRTLTVREMARIQSFPDWFEFKSKITTGGKLRKYEVPQYSQVGNAVPPLLALNLGNVIKKQIENVSKRL